MTYGEVLYQQRELCEMKNGEIVIRKLPERMKRQECIKYYNLKLEKVWQGHRKLKYKYQEA